MIYNEIGSGGVIDKGCAPIDILRHFSTLFAPGDTVYIVQKANRGILESITVKKVRIAPTSLTWGQPVALYVDTFNSLWNESDLTDYATAASIIAEVLAPDPTLIGGVICKATALIQFTRQPKTFYSVAKANRGILEEVVVKDVRNTVVGTYLYVDTFNALWNTQELTDYDTASTLAMNYLLGLSQQVAGLKTCPK